MKTNRDRKTGKYTDTDLNKLCVCGHRLGVHTAAKVGNEQPCLDPYCHCECFRKAKR
jgi:hypothetical protein